MLNETFYLDGIDARSAGIQLQAPIEFSEAVPVVEAQTIPGRNGDLIWETGNYENRSAEAECFCLQKDVEKAISSAGRFLMGKKGYRRLETSDDPDHYWMARVENSPKIAMRLRTLAPFEIGFDCKPQRFLKSGDDPIVISVPNAEETHISIYNPYGFTSHPLIEIQSGTSDNAPCIISCNKRKCKVNRLIETMFLDSDIQNAYNERGNQNHNITCTDFIVLEPGENDFSVFSTAPLTVKITPRWWEL